MTEWKKDEPYPAPKLPKEKLREGRIAQVVALIDTLILDHVVLESERHTNQGEDPEHIAQFKKRVEESRESLKRALEQLLL